MLIKFCLLLSLFPFFLFAQNSNYSVFELDGKKGIKSKNSSDTLIQAKYEYIRKVDNMNGFVLCESIDENKTFLNAKFLDANLQPIEKFESILQFDNNHIVVKKGKQFAYYNLKFKKYLIQNAISFEALKAYTSKEFKKKSFKHLSVFPSFYDGNKSLVFSPYGNKIIEIEGQIPFSIYKNDNLILAGNKEFSIYSVEGKKVLESVTVLEPFIRQPYEINLIRAKLANGNYALLKNGKTLIHSHKGKFSLKNQNPNRFHLWLGYGYIVLDSNGRQIGTEVYDQMNPISNDKSIPNLVNFEGEWKFVDQNLFQLNEEKFTSAKIVDDVMDYNYCYLLQTEELAVDQYYVYDKFGKKVMEETVEEAFSLETINGNLLVLEKGLKYAFSFDGTNFSDFEFSEIQTLQNESGEMMALAKKNGEFVLYQGNLEKEYFTGFNLGKIDFIEYLDVLRGDIVLLLFKKGSKSFSLAYFDSEHSNFKLYGDYNLLDFEIYEEFLENVGCFQVRKKSGWGLINLNFKEFTSFEYDQFSMNSDNIELTDYQYLKVLQNKKQGILSITTDPYSSILKPIYSEIRFIDEFLVFKQKKLYGIINENEESLSIKTACLKEFPTRIIEQITGYESETKAILNGKNQYCYVTGQNNIVFGDKISNPEWGEGSRYLIQKDGLFGMINENWDTLIPASLQSIEIDQNLDYLITKKENLYGLRDYIGRNILQEEYEKITQFPDQRGFLLEKNEKFGFYLSSQKSLDTVYDEIQYHNGKILSRIGNQCQMFNSNLKEIKQGEYSSLKEFRSTIE